jgi:pimeloyl-ACP methyl ester carboxylesterase
VEAFAVEAGGAPVFVRTWGGGDRPALLYWDGLAGCGLHANELATILTNDYGLRVIAVDAPGHGDSPPLALEDYMPSVLAKVVAELLSALGLANTIFFGFSWGAEVGCAFAARYPELVTRLVLVDGGYVDFADLPDFDVSATLSAHVARSRKKADEDCFPSWDAYFAAESSALGRWTPALAEAHRATMREEDGRIVPILDADVVGAINYGNCREPTASTYAGLRAGGVPILLVTPTQHPQFGLIADNGITRFQEEVPQLRVEHLPGDVHDLVSSAPEELAAVVGRWLRE